MASSFDPRAKGAVYLLLTVLTLVTLAPAPLLALVVAEATLLLAARLVTRWLAVLRVLAPTLVMFAVVAWFAGGEIIALSAVLRLLALTTAGVLFFASTAPEDLGEALQASGLSPRTAYLLEGSLRFVPTMGALFQDVRDAQMSRGIRLDGWHLARNAPTLLAPVLVSAVRLADELAEALEARGFGSGQRTLMRDHRWRGRDWSLVAVATLAAVAYILVIFRW